MSSRAILTIDDISSKNTPAVVDYLVEKGITPVLFAVGDNVDNYRAEAIYALKKGAIVGNHSVHHPAFSDLSFEEAKKEILDMEKFLDELYAEAGVERKYHIFRFPYGDRGNDDTRDRLQEFFKEQGFDKLDDVKVTSEGYRNSGQLERIDTLWSFDFAEYTMHGGEISFADIMARIEDKEKNGGADILEEDSFNLILLHAHDLSDEIEPGYYRTLVDYLIDRGCEFVRPEFK